MLAHAVDLGDRRPGLDQRRIERQGLAVVESGGGQREQRRGSAGQQCQHQIVRSGAGGEGQHARRHVFGDALWHGERRFDHVDAACRCAIPFQGDDEALDPCPVAGPRRPGFVQPLAFHRTRHRRRRLAGAKHDGPAARRWRQVPRHQLGGVRRGEGGIKQATQDGVGIGDHGENPAPVSLPADRSRTPGGWRRRRSSRSPAQ